MDGQTLHIFCITLLRRFISESIPWLVAKGRIRNAKKILEKAARWNNVELPEKYKLTEEEEQLLKIIVRSRPTYNSPRLAMFSLRFCWYFVILRNKF